MAERKIWFALSVFVQLTFNYISSTNENPTWKNFCGINVPQKVHLNRIHSIIKKQYGINPLKYLYFCLTAFILLTQQDDGPLVKGDPFYESQENHNLIGVANIFLECLFHDVTLDYHVPIISQQGEVIDVKFLKLHPTYPLCTW